MSPDFWAGYISGALGICVGNPLDVIKVQLQAGRRVSPIASNISQGRCIPNLLQGMFYAAIGIFYFFHSSDLFILEQVQQRQSSRMGLSTQSSL
jgi:hypothetical protein